MSQRTLLRNGLIIIGALAVMWLAFMLRYENLHRKVFPAKTTQIIRAEERKLNLPQGGERSERFGCNKDVYGQVHCDNSINLIYPDTSLMKTIQKHLAQEAWTLDDESTINSEMLKPMTIYSYTKPIEGQTFCTIIQTGGGIINQNKSDALNVYISAPDDDDCGNVN